MSTDNPDAVPGMEDALHMGAQQAIILALGVLYEQSPEATNRLSEFVDTGELGLPDWAGPDAALIAKLNEATKSSAHEVFVEILGFQRRIDRH
jgi:hypothetical protein